jgi:hypothetical protein
MHKRSLTKLLGLTVLATISVMAMSASAAQAKYLLLLNGTSALELHIGFKGLKGKLKAENGLKIECQSSDGLAIAKSLEEGKKVSIINASGIFKECKWIGSEKTCTINDGGVGLINAVGTGEIGMLTPKEYLIKLSGKPFTTVLTEGAFCTIPEEEVVEGGVHILIPEELPQGTLILGSLAPLELKLGNSKVSELTGEVHLYDFLDPTANIGIHLVGAL